MIFKELKIGDSFFIKGTPVTMVKTRISRIEGHGQKNVDFNCINCSTGVMQFLEDDVEVTKQ